MAFKNLLRLSFVILSILPLGLAGYVIQRISIDSRIAKTENRLAIHQAVAGDRYLRADSAGRAALRELPRSLRFQQVLESGARPAVEALLRPYDTQTALAFVVKRGDGSVVIGGEPTGGQQIGAVANVGKLGSLAAYVDPSGLRDGAGLVVGGRLYANGVDRSISELRGTATHEATIDGQHYRVSVAPISQTDAPVEASIVAYEPQVALDRAIRRLRLTTLGIVGFVALLVAVLGWLILRNLSGLLRSFASGARAVAAGRFDQRLPVRGNDEFAQFGQAFNDMSTQLEARVADLELERTRVREFGARFGQALASTHDVGGLLGIVLDSAMQLANAQGGRLLVADEGSDALVEQLRRGSVGEASQLLDAPVRFGDGVEGRALQASGATREDAPVPILAAPLVAEERVLGLLTLVRPEGPAFTDEDAQRVGSLVGQGAVAIENARLHRLIQKQAKTDSLTGLLNRREFEEQLGREVERAQRFSESLGLVVLDLDDFKLINDKFGHLTGDAVLKSTAIAILDCTRDIDQCARWGGEEFAVILPHTDLEGAARLAERLRQAIADRPVTTSDGRTVRVTASLGVAALPTDATTQVELTAAADAAVYRGKRGGKNRVCLAHDNPT